MVHEAEWIEVPEEKIAKKVRFHGKKEIRAIPATGRMEPTAKARKTKKPLREVSTSWADDTDEERGIDAVGRADEEAESGDDWETRARGSSAKKNF